MDHALDTGFIANLAALAAIAQAVCEPVAAASAIVELTISTFELAGASVGRVREDDAGSRLESLAAAGDRSAFVRELSIPLDTLTDAARAVVEGVPQFVGDPYGLGLPTGAKAEGVARWRSGLDANAHAVLPLRGPTGVFGALTLQWSQAREFADDEREALCLWADVAALVLEFAEAEVELESEHALAQRAVAAEVAMRAATLVTAAYDITEAGVVMPAGEATWSATPALRVWTACASQGTGADADAFAEVLEPGRGAVVGAVGTITAPAGGADDVLETGRRVLRAAAAHHETDPAHALGMLGGVTDEGRSESWMSALVAEIDVAASTLCAAAAGSVAIAVRGADGRLDLSLSKTGPMRGAREIAPERLRLLLPGDRVALLAGRTVRLADDEGRDGVAGGLANLPDLGGEETACALMRLVREPGGAAAVIVVEVCERSAER